MKLCLVKFCLINVAAHPHPDGIYKDVFARATGRPINFRSDQWAVITQPREEDEGRLLFGRVLVWTEIDKGQPVIKKREWVQATLTESNAQIPENIGFNGKSFYYTFRVSDHRLFVEIRNDQQASISPRLVYKIFEILFGEKIQCSDVRVEVTLIPEHGTVHGILDNTGLRELRIKLVQPNGDDIFHSVEDILAGMKNEGAVSLETTMRSGQTTGPIRPSENTRRIAEVAEHNGFVEAVGKGPDGKNITFSTRDRPKIISVPIPQNSSSEATALQVARATG